MTTQVDPQATGSSLIPRSAASLSRSPSLGELSTSGAFAGWAGAILFGLVAAVAPGAQCATQSLTFGERPALGDVLTFTVSTADTDTNHRATVLDCLATDAQGRHVVAGTVTVRPPRPPGPAGSSIDRPVPAPGVIVHEHHRYEELVSRCQEGGAVPTAVVYPLDRSALTAAVEAAAAGIIVPILVGPAQTLRDIARVNGLDIGAWSIVDAPTDAAAAAAGARLVQEDQAQLLMKGSLHTSTLLRAVLAHDTGLRHAEWISHVFVFDVPAYPKPLLLSDAVVAIAPTLEQKAVICRNAITVAHALGIALPKVAILSAIEDIDPAIPSTIDAAALCKMADRGQITGAVLDGPLAMDNAISMASATTKGIISSVAGDADILIVPNLEAGNILYKNLTYLADAEAAGVIVGAAVPIILASRADTVRTRIASAALASVLAAYQRAAAANSQTDDASGGPSRFGDRPPAKQE